jgi:hypothetical protein
MKNNNRIENEEQLLNALEEFLCDVSEDEPIENVENALRSLGYDPTILKSKGKTISNLSLANSPLNWRNAGKKEIEIARENLDKIRISNIKELDRNSIINEIRKILSSLDNKNSNFAPAYFRNFETASDSDLSSMLDQLKFLTSNDENKDAI